MKPIPLAQRFWPKVDTTAGPTACWPWKAATFAHGYGAIGGGRRGGPMLKAHRVAWELTHGAIPAGLFVCHRCDNPPCCNPGHLFLGTPADNARDMVAKGRQAGPRHNVVLTEDLVAEARRRARAGEPRVRLAREIAGRVGATHDAVLRAIRGGWPHVAEDPVPGRVRSHRKGA